MGHKTLALKKTKLLFKVIQHLDRAEATVLSLIAVANTKGNTLITNIYIIQYSRYITEAMWYFNPCVLFKCFQTKNNVHLYELADIRCRMYPNIRTHRILSFLIIILEIVGLYVFEVMG